MGRLISFVFFLICLSSCGAPPQTQQGGMPPPPMVGVAAPIVRQLPVVRELTGRVEAVESVELRPRIGGVIDRVLVVDGSEVKAGDVLLQIDPQPLRLAVTSAQAQIAHAQARAKQAHQQYERTVPLVQNNILPQQQLDDLDAAAKSADADLAVAQAAQENAQLNLDYAQVKSPISGRIGKILTTAGNLVQGGGPVPATLLSTIVSVDPINVVFDLDEETWRLIGERLRTAARDGSAVPVAVGLTGENGFPHVGVVAFADNQVDPKTGSIRLRARLANADRALTPGAFARVQLETAPPRQVLLINEAAVQSQLATRYVLVVDEKGGTQFRPVRLGDKIEQLRVVEEGLAANERIAVTGLAKIFFPGMPVTPMPVSMATLTPDEQPPQDSSGSAASTSPASTSSASSSSATNAQAGKP